MLLLSLNLRSFVLVWEEMTAAQHMTARGLIAAESLMLGGSTVVALWFRSAGRRITPSWASGLLLGAVAYLWWSLVAVGDLFPLSVTQWIVRPDDWIYYQAMLVMPAVVHGLLLLTAKASTLASGPKPFLIILALSAVAVPIAVACAIAQPSAALIVAPWILAALGMTAVFVHAVVAVYDWSRRTSPTSLAAYTALVALLLPVGGLSLNAALPFPVNFQSTAIYVLTLLNGLALCLPNFRSVRLHRAVWLLQAAFFPVTVYFFLVFLPYLAVAVPAMLFLGTGVFVLTPTALFLLHGGRLWDGFRNEVRDGGRLRPALAGAGAMLLLPALIVLEATAERQVLSRALDYVYTPQRASTETFSGHPALVRLSLQRLQDRQQGLVLPFLTDFYQWAIFNGLTLPPEKITFMAKFFGGKELAPKKVDRFFGERRPSMRERIERPQTDQVTLSNLASSVREDGNSMRTRVTLQMRNSAGAEGEFVTELHVPTGVFVSGFALKIGEKMVPGRITEKKAALWVYQKIRDVVRRDPGLLTYTGPEKMELRAYPLAPGEERTLEIEFLAPKAAPGRLEIGGRPVLAGLSEPSNEAVLAAVEGGDSGLLLPQKALPRLPAVERHPYIHFIIDRSLSSATTSPETWRTRLAEAARSVPEASECLIDLGNYEGVTVTDKPVPISQLATLPNDALTRLPARGGFVEDRAVKRALLRYRQGRAAEDDAWARRYPIIVVLTASSEPKIAEGDLASFAFITPEVDGYARMSPEHSEPVEASWSNGGAFTPWRLHQVHPVAVLKCGATCEAVAIDGTSPALLTFPNPGAVMVWNHERWEPLSGVTTLEAGESYSRAIALWLQSRAQALNPGAKGKSVGDLLRASRNANVMVPESAFMVVESVAQWKVLQEKEDQKLSENQALEVEATPEPTTCTLLLTGAGWLATRRWRRQQGSGVLAAGKIALT